MSSSRLAIFIDGANIDAPARQASIRINYVRFHAYLVGTRNAILANYYESKTSHPGKKAFYEAVKKAGFKVVLGPVAYFGKQKEIDVQIAVDMVSGAYQNTFDIAVLGSGDGDMAPVVRKLISMKKEVEVVSWNDPGKGQLAWTLKKSATRVRDLTYDVKKII
jgi:uncharacterized LabA/DUF88 family protein